MSGPLSDLSKLAADELSRRASAAASNRAKFPELAAVTDYLRKRYPDATVKLLWAENDQGESIGRKP